MGARVDSVGGRLVVLYPVTNTCRRRTSLSLSPAVASSSATLVAKVLAFSVAAGGSKVVHTLAIPDLIAPTSAVPVTRFRFRLSPSILKAAEPVASGPPVEVLFGPDVRLYMLEVQLFDAENRRVSDSLSTSGISGISIVVACTGEAVRTAPQALPLQKQEQADESPEDENSNTCDAPSSAGVWPPGRFLCPCSTESNECASPGLMCTSDGLCRTKGQVPPTSPLASSCSFELEQCRNAYAECTIYDSRCACAASYKTCVRGAPCDDGKDLFLREQVLSGTVKRVCDAVDDSCCDDSLPPPCTNADSQTLNACFRAHAGVSCKDIGDHAACVAAVRCASEARRAAGENVFLRCAQHEADTGRNCCSDADAVRQDCAEEQRVALRACKSKWSGAVVQAQTTDESVYSRGKQLCEAVGAYAECSYANDCGGRESAEAFDDVATTCAHVQTRIGRATTCCPPKPTARFRQGEANVLSSDTTSGALSLATVAAAGLAWIVAKGLN